MESEDIRQLRQRLGWSLADFGRYFGVTAQAVLKWERGTAQPNDFALATMIQLRSGLDAAVGEQQKQQFINGLKRALLTGGILALLAYLFNQED
ncbi:helix-turn-helix domain-containing protein [Aliifodinibius sp. S!AR15-10]|uniref:helix-turn-helix domain-containing protein n=1 Tax=Aliifodinibius sp. S!AR15-10 TaxID=2950437 RepID=UPI00285AE6A6|nr:helix-turn-helix domain-containing protein [Aliifodinibius sp. S!AR15-10]MDR8389908.1 helix-turn-helix domain-containing protein [Aliifodinibius sp. S!AR15-10]